MPRPNMLFLFTNLLTIREIRKEFWTVLLVFVGMIKRKHVMLVVFCSTVPSTNLMAQIALHGRVTDNGDAYLGSGAEPVVNALVTLTGQADTSRTLRTHTDVQGQYALQVLPTAIHMFAEQPAQFRLWQNYPNPFNPSTVIGYEISRPSHLTLEIYNGLGQRIKTLLDGFHSGPGQVVWDATDARGQGVAAGMYIYILGANGNQVSRKMLLLDGYQGGTRPLLTNGRDRVGPPGDGKRLSEKYTLRITGEAIAPFEQRDLEIVVNTTFDVTVNRTVTDADSHVYRAVKIGDQWWMAENLSVTHYRTNDPIPHVTDKAQWTDITTGAYSAYDNNDEHVATYGRLYNAYAVEDRRGICPEGWHVPSDEEWIRMEMFLGMSQSEAAIMTAWRGSKEGQMLKSTSYGGADETGFAALGTGYRDPDGVYRAEHSDNNYWTSTTVDNNGSVESILHGLVRRKFTIVRNFHVQNYGFSIRCIRQ